MKDLSAERAVLSSLFKEGAKSFAEISDLISYNSFTLELNKNIYEALELAFTKNGVSKMDLPTFHSNINSLGYNKLFEKSENNQVLRAIINFEMDSTNLRAMAVKLRRLEIARELSKKTGEVDDYLETITGDEPLSQIVSNVENFVLDYTNKLKESSTEGPQKISEGIEDYVDYLVNNPCEQVGISSGYPLYDMFIGGGFRRKTVNVVGAPKKTGKTTWADNVCLHVAGKLGFPVLNADAEMSKEDHWNRMLANISGVKIKEIETGKFASSEVLKSKVDAAVNHLKKIPYHYISTAGSDWPEVEGIVRRWLMKEVGYENGSLRDCLLVYDYIKLIDPGQLKSMQEYQVLGFQMTGLHNLTVRYNFPCLTFTQLNREGYVAASDRIKWICSNYSTFSAKTQEETAEDISAGCSTIFNRKLFVEHARHGPGNDLGDYINFKLSGGIGRLEEGITRNTIHLSGGSGKTPKKSKGDKDHEPVF